MLETQSRDVKEKEQVFIQYYNIMHIYIDEYQYIDNMYWKYNKKTKIFTAKYRTMIDTG